MGATARHLGSGLVRRTNPSRTLRRARGPGSADPGPLRILVIADAKITVPPEGYGGTERIVALLCAGLAARGHQVTLMAAKGSRNYGRLITHPWADASPIRTGRGASSASRR